MYQYFVDFVKIKKSQSKTELITKFGAKVEGVVYVVWVVMIIHVILNTCFQQIKPRLLLNFF